MKISELIKKLTALKEEHGDLECKTPDSCSLYEPIDAVRWLDYGPNSRHEKPFIGIWG